MAVAPFGQRRPSLIGLSGSPSICRSCVVPPDSLVYAISPQPTAQYGQTEWTSLAPAMRRSSARFFAAARSKPSGFARGTSAIPAVPAAPSFRNSRRVISVIGSDTRSTPAIPDAQPTALTFSPDERVLRVAGQALDEGCGTARREDRAACARPEDCGGTARARASRVAHEGATLCAPCHVHGRHGSGTFAGSETRGCGGGCGVHPGSARGAGARGAGLTVTHA